MSTTDIEWARNADGSKGQTWNPVAGCAVLSPGCTHCYAMKQAHRIQLMGEKLPSGHGGAPHYAGTTKIVNGKPVWTGRIGIAADEVFLKPLRRKTPTTYFVNSMSDLFHEAVPDAVIDRIFAIMALTPQHTYQVLTKRSARMRDYLSWRFVEKRWAAAGGAFLQNYAGYGRVLEAGNPLPNVWLGVSAEDQRHYDERADDLRTTPAAVRFFSMEPLLGPIIAPWLGDWVIVGGESGPDARPMHPDWARSLRDQCAAAGVSFFFKQWGNWRPEIDRDRDDPDWRQPYTNFIEPHFRILNLAGGRGFHGERVHVMRHCSKKSAGRLLDGAVHDAMPTDHRLVPAQRARVPS